MAEFPAGAREAIDAIAADFTEFDSAEPDTGPDGPLDWAGYAQQRDAATARSGANESVLCGRARIGSRSAVLIAFDFRYIGGSLGQRAGARIRHAFEIARRDRIMVVSLLATGGSRMQEGMRSLVQLQRIAEQCQRTRAAGIAHVTVAGHPTTGGVWASLGAGADVILALPTATVAFAGHRVRPSGPQDGDAFLSEGKLSSGQVDQIIDPLDLPSTVNTLVELLAPTTDSPVPAEVPRALGHREPASGGWSAVQRARAADRPRAAAYLDDYFDTRFALSGDRAGGRDPGMLCGFGRRAGRTIAYAAQTGTANAPAGFRTASRLIRTADALNLPVLTLIDTPGAANDAAAERAGIGPALAELFGTVAAASVPVTSLVIGEGGSGGALALASPDRLWITEDGYFSVIVPEASAAILKRGPEDVETTAEQLRLRPRDLLDLGIVHGIAR